MPKKQRQHFKIINKKGLFLALPLIVVPTAAIVASVIYIQRENDDIRRKRIDRENLLKWNQGSFESNVAQVETIVDQFKDSTINITTLRKSLKMTFDLYRGGSFDFTDANIIGFAPKDVKNASYTEIIEFIKKADATSLVSLNDNFTNIEFKKNFYTKMSLIPEVHEQLDGWAKSVDGSGDTVDPSTFVSKTKKQMIDWGIKAIWDLPRRNWHTRGKSNLNDFNFYSENDKNENDISTFVSEEKFKEYFRYEFTNGDLITFEDLETKINSLSSPNEVVSLIKSLNAPAVKFNLDDRFLLKFKNVDTKEVSITNENRNGTGTAVNVTINNWDPVFGIKTSWYDVMPFQSNYYQKNVISPMFLIDEEKGHFNRNDNEEFNEMYDGQPGVYHGSINYATPLSYEQILNYKSENHMFNNNNSKYSIKLNENRYFENKLHEQQTAKHGLEPMSEVDMFNQTMTADYSPNIRTEYITMWQYVSKYIQWGWKSTWPTPGQIDTAHKNGVEIYGTLFTDSPSSMITRLLADTEEGRYIWADNLIKILVDTGVDGVLWNLEIGGWQTTGISQGALSAWQRLSSYMNDQLEKAGKKVLIYGNFNTELPRTPHDMNEFLQDGDPEYNYGSDFGWRNGMTPSNGDAHFYHYDENLKIEDKPLGYAHRNGMNDLFLSFIDKDSINGVSENQYADKYGVPISFAKERNEFAKANPEYNLIVLGSDSAYSSTVEFMQREMEFLSKEHLASEYYADYSVFADGAGSWNSKEKFEWEMAEYISRTKDYDQITGGIPGMPGMGWTSQNDAPWSEANGYYGKHDWGQLSQDPRSVSRSYSNYFQERSTVDDRNFYTAFNVGYGDSYTLNGESIYGPWQNIGFQDFYPTYRYLIDVYDKNGDLIDDSANNYTKRKINAFIDQVDDAYQGNDALHYKGLLDANESFINKLYVSNITKDKEFSIFVKNDEDLKTTLQVWRNKQANAEEVAPSKTETVNGYKKLTFNVSASDVNKITSFGLKVKNASLSNKAVNLENYRVGAISFVDQTQSIQSHSNVISSFYAETNNIINDGINVKFEDQYFDENSRYVIYNDQNHPVAISSRPEFHVRNGGSYTIKVFNPIGDSLGSYQIHLNEIKLN